MIQLLFLSLHIPPKFQLASTICLWKFRLPLRPDFPSPRLGSCCRCCWWVFYCWSFSSNWCSLHPTPCYHQMFLSLAWCPSSGVKTSSFIETDKITFDCGEGIHWLHSLISLFSTSPFALSAQPASSERASHFGDVGRGGHHMGGASQVDAARRAEGLSRCVLGRLSGWRWVGSCLLTERSTAS